MSVRIRAVVAMLVAFGLGAVMAWATDQGGASRTLVSQLRNTIGGLSTPWVLIPFVAGALCLRRLSGALMGLAATMFALAGWYLCATLLEDLGGHGFFGDLRLEFGANQVWFLAGLLSGPLFGAFGSWWHARRRLPAAVVAGALLMGEPLVMFALTGLHAAHVLHGGGNGVPMLLAVVTNYWVSGTLSIVVLVCEFLLGAVVAALAVRRATPRLPA